MSIKYCSCEGCGREMNLGAEAYYYKEKYLCERCFDIEMDKLREESQINITEDCCDGYDKNECCFSYDW